MIYLHQSFSGAQNSGFGFQSVTFWDNLNKPLCVPKDKVIVRTLNAHAGEGHMQV